MKSRISPTPNSQQSTINEKVATFEKQLDQEQRETLFDKQRQELATLESIQRTAIAIKTIKLYGAQGVWVGGTTILFIFHGRFVQIKVTADSIACKCAIRWPDRGYDIERHEVGDIAIAIEKVFVDCLLLPTKELQRQISKQSTGRFR